MRPWSIRAATVDDMAEVVRVRLDGWRATYSQQMGDAFLTRMEAMRDREIANRRARFGTDGLVQWVGVVGGEVVGWAASGPPRDEDVAVARELYAIYTDQSAHGSGMAAALLEAVLGTAPAALWVLEDNPRARAFYSRHGFVADGARTMLDGELSDISEIRMVRPLT